MAGRMLALVTLVCTGTLFGCGEEPRFSAREFVDEVNRRGAALALGPSLETTRQDRELHELQFADGASAESSEPASGDSHADGGGTLVVTASESEASEEYERCEGSVSLLCYRAANVAFYFADSIPPDDRLRLEAALHAIAAEQE